MSTKKSTEQRPPFKASVVKNTAPGGRLCKVQEYDAKGDDLRSWTDGTLYRGSVTLESFHSIEDFMTRRSELGTSEALMMGKPIYSRASIVTKKALKRIPAATRHADRIIAKDRAHMAWPEGAAVVMLDLDRPEEFPPEVQDLLPDSPEGWRDLLVDLVPGLEHAPMAWAASSSSCIYREEEELRGLSGQRFYFVIDRGVRIPEFKDALRHALIMRGLFWFIISANGRLLERFPFDLAVYQPERLDFAGGPDCAPPLTWRPPPAKIWNSDGPYLVSDDLPQITAEQRREADHLAWLKKQAKAPEAEVVRERTTAEAGRKIAVHHAGLDPQVATTVARHAVEKGVLLPEFILTECDGRAVTVGELLEDPDANDGRRFHDPLEPEYRNDSRIAVFLAHEGATPIIYSHAHGGQSWRCQRKVITVRIGPIDRTVDQIKAALQQDHCDLFVSGDAIVAVDEAGGYMQPLDVDGLALRLQRRLDVRGRNANGDWIPKDIPQRSIKALMSEASALPLPRLDAVVRGPHARADGSIVDTPGYDPVSRVLYVSDSPSPPRVRTEISIEEANEALDRIWYPFSKFSYKTALDRGVALAAILTTVVRLALGIVPGFLVTAPVAASGKTLFTQAVGHLQTGRPTAVSALSGDEEEIRKQTFASLRQGSTYLLFDNAQRGSEIDSAVLANLITTPDLEGRVLGQSRIERRPNRLTVVLTGNNVFMRGDLNRRILSIALDPAVERPYEREFDFRPTDHVEANWMALRIAALELIEAARNAGAFPPEGATAFPDWDYVVRGTVRWIINNLDIGVEFADPLGAIRAAYEQDSETEDLGRLQRTWYEAFGDRELLLSEVDEEVMDGDADPPPGSPGAALIAFDEARQSVLGPRAATNGNSRTALGKYISGHAGRVVDGLRFVVGGKSGGSRRYRVERVGES